MAAINNSFRLRHYDCIGFDMQYQILAEYMVSRKGYDIRLQQLPVGPEDLDFLLKGLVLDVERGNFLKVSSCGEILRASHGTKPLSREETAKCYGPTRTDDWLRRLAEDPMIDTTESHLFHRKFRPFKDYFDLPAALVSARIVDLLDYGNNNKPLDKYSFWRDVLCGLVHMFDRDNLKQNLGGYYPAMKARPESYLRPCSEQLKKWLQDLKRRQVTFLISGSDPEYVDHVASFCLGQDWQSYFDFVICASKKPGFFHLNRPFQRYWIKRNDEKMKNDDFMDLEELLVGDTKTIYTQGNWSQLRASMAEYCGVENPKCIYFGDHLIQDVLAAGRLDRVDSVAILEELEVEDPCCIELNNKMRSSSSRWGSFFRDESQLSGEIVPTLWNRLIEQHSRLSIPDVEILAQHSVDHTFFPFYASSSTSIGNKFLGFLMPSRRQK